MHTASVIQHCRIKCLYGLWSWYFSVAFLRVISMEPTFQLTNVLSFSDTWYNFSIAAHREIVLCFASSDQLFWSTFKIWQDPQRTLYTHSTALFAVILLHFAAASFFLLEDIKHAHLLRHALTLTLVLLTLHWKLGSGTPSASQVRTLCLASSAWCSVRLVITAFPEANTLCCYWQC